MNLDMELYRWTRGFFEQSSGCCGRDDGMSYLIAVRIGFSAPRLASRCQDNCHLRCYPVHGLIFHKVRVNVCALTGLLRNLIIRIPAS